MKVLHIINSLEIGGAQRLLSDLIPYQIEQGFDVHILVGEEKKSDFTKKIQSVGCRILRVNSTKYKSFASIRAIRKVIKNYEVVHVHLFPSLYLAAIASLGLKTKLIYTEHSTSNRRRSKSYFRPIEQFIYKQYDKIVSISQQTQTALQNWLKSYDNRFVIINNGVDIKKFSSLKRPIKDKSLIMVSRFVDAKDQPTVIKALKYLDSDVTLTLVGDGEKLDNYKELATSIGVDDRVHFLGSRSDIAELISSSYIGIQSSNWEGFGLTAVELMAAGKPVIASDVDGLKQVVEGAGLIFEKGNPRQLAEKINTLLQNPEIYAETAAKCFDRASQFDIQLMADKYLQVYLN